MLSIDLDHFKQINDTHGHAGGDQVLIETSRRLGDASPRAQEALAHARDAPGHGGGPHRPARPTRSWSASSRPCESAVINPPA